MLCFAAARSLSLSAFVGFGQQRRPHLHSMQRRAPQPRRRVLLCPELEARLLDIRIRPPARQQPRHSRRQRGARVSRAGRVSQAHDSVLARSSRGVHHRQVRTWQCLHRLTLDASSGTLTACSCPAAVASCPLCLPCSTARATRSATQTCGTPRPSLSVFL